MQNYPQRAIAGSAAHAGLRTVDARTASRGSQWLLLGVIVVSTLLLAVRLNVDSNLADDPVQKNVAELVLHGQRPHANFSYAYTGGLVYLHALALRIFGDRELSLRLMLLVFFVAWLPSFWYIARKLTSPIGAALLTLLAAVWSVPIYPSPLGTWYGLYFATFGTAALFRYIENRRSRWVFVAGVLAGLSFLMKVSGLYFLLAAVLFLVFDEQSVQDEVRYGEHEVPDSTYSVLLTLVLVGLDIILLLLLRSRANITEVYHFALPGIALSFLLIVREWGMPRFPVPVRLWQIGGRLLPLLLGAFIPVIVFLTPYVSSGTLGKWFLETLVMPAIGWQAAFHSAINPVGALCAIPLLVILLINAEVRSNTARRLAFVALCLAGAESLNLALVHPEFARWVWVSAATAIPITTAIGVFLLLSGTKKGQGKQRSQLMLLIAVAGLCSLVQFPLSAPVYFCCVVPLGILAFIGLANLVSDGRPMLLLLPLAGFYLAFVTLLILPNKIYREGLSFRLSPGAAIAAPPAVGMENPGTGGGSSERSATSGPHADGLGRR
ncbi:MAG: glycosyltransferase family 39 protein [Candidatus Korobacteraceae bacterium]